jgi:hypothetical protein
VLEPLQRDVQRDGTTDHCDALVPGLELPHASHADRGAGLLSVHVSQTHDMALGRPPPPTEVRERQCPQRAENEWREVK